MLEAVNIRRKRNGVPILNRKEMDELGETIVQNTYPDILVHPAPLDIDRFVEIDMGLSVDYVFLSNCQCYLGLMAFDNIRQPVWNPDKNRAEYLEVLAGTILIDNSLLVGSQEHRLRFTMAHEAAGHAFLHRPYYHRDINQISIFDTVSNVYPCRNPGGNLKFRPIDDIGWMEWQADVMAASVLMPRSAVMLLLNEARMHFGYQASFTSYVEFNRYFADCISETFNVSHTAARIRALEINDNARLQPFIN